MSDLIDAIVNAHGGLDRWQATPFVRLRLSSGGLAFTVKGQRLALRDVEAYVATEGQEVHLYAAGDHAHLRGDVLTVERASGSAVETPAAIDSFRGFRRQLRWSRTDILRFAAIAIWTYTSIPFVLVRDDIEIEALDPWRQSCPHPWRRLAVHFPDHLHTHSAEQVLYFDERLRLRRHDYTAEAFGSWAEAAHFTSSYQEFGGLAVPTRRRVYPRKRNNRHRPHPLLVWIDIQDLRPATDPARR